MKKLIFFIPILSNILFAQISEQKEFADSLFNSGKYYQSITEYKRLQYFDSKNIFISHINYQIALAYKFGGFYKNSENYFRKTLANSESIKKTNKIKFEIAKLFIIQQKKEKAISLLDSLLNKGANESEVNYWKGWAHLLSYETDKAEFYFKKSEIAKTIVDSLLSIENEEYSVNLAKGLSFVVPGAGQFYTGNYLSGTISFAWNLIWGSLTIKAFSDRRIVEGILIADLLWLRFYKGNIYNAEKFAIDKNVKLVDNLFKDLQNNYKGKLP